VLKRDSEFLAKKLRDRAIKMRFFLSTVFPRCKSPVFLSLLCALCSCFVLRASCSCFVLIRFFGHRLPSTKHKARSIRTVTLPRRSRSHENRVFLSHTAKQKAQSMSTKQPILTKRCDFEHKARSAKHKARSMSTKQRQKNWAKDCNMPSANPGE
jgi:hypothetical protein